MQLTDEKVSRSVVFIPTDDDALKMSLPLSVLHNKIPIQSDVWMSGIIDKYRAGLKHGSLKRFVCMADFASEYRIVYGQNEW